MASSTRPAPAPIDPRGPRTNQAVLATALLLGFLTGWWYVAPVFAVRAVPGCGLRASAYGPVLRFYAAVIRPRLDPPTEMEDPRPPRFAATVGVSSSRPPPSPSWSAPTPLGWTLALIVAALAGLSAVSGICVGCEMYLAVRPPAAKPSRWWALSAARGASPWPS